jgi:tetratricopeptide (TPR) repeat protein
MLAALALRTPAQTGGPQNDLQQADAFFRSQQWAEAARAYEAVTKTEPANGSAWFRLGLSLHSAGQYARAIDAMRQAEALRFQQPGARYRIARAFAKLGEKEQAFTWLNKAVESGFSQLQALNTDPDIAGLRDDPRFKAALATAETMARPCSTRPEYKQFDFWVGEWDVSTGGQPVATSSIQRIVEGCVIFENYTQADGYVGKSFNFFDSQLGRWRQTWVDGGGRVSEFSGVFKDGEMRFEGESHLADGAKVMRHMTFFNLGPDKVRQRSEVSTDGGKTWNVNYDFIYTRKR